MAASHRALVNALRKAQSIAGFLGRYIRFSLLLFLSVFILTGISFWTSYEFRFDFQVPPYFGNQRLILLPYVALIKTFVFYILRGHSALWRYVGVSDIPGLVLQCVVGALLLALFPLLNGDFWIPRGVIVIDFLLGIVLVGGARIGFRVAREKVLIILGSETAGVKRPTMILGAEDAGEMLLREIQRNPHSGYEVLGFFDDDSSKWGSKIHGIPILGSVESSSAFAERRGIKVAIVAIPSLAHARMRRIYEILKPLNVYVKTLPGVHEIIEGAPALTQLRDVNISDLLRREEVRIDTEQVNNLVHGKTILVTGAGGSIGSELCSQIYRRRPGLLVLMERAENALFETHRSLCGMAVSECAVIPYLCDVTDLARVNRAFRIYKPQLVFHAAAHKHVPLQELNASECFKNNVGGMRVLSHAAHEYASEVFVLVSTDKAVNPSSVMGATKRVCEMYGQAFAETSPTHFLSVRFGNVLASQGSVVPIFMDQISRGGPVTVTHPEMRRYFMTIPEAVTLILQAAVLGKSGEIMALEMGEPTRIVDLARHLIELMDGDPENIRIEYTGLRAGEKLYEEIRFDDEAYGKTTHEKIRTIHGPGKYGDHITGLVEKALERAGECADDDEIRRILKSLVPEYTA